jgi:hypothetical protein
MLYYLIVTLATALMYWFIVQYVDVPFGVHFVFLLLLITHGVPLINRLLPRFGLTFKPSSSAAARVLKSVRDEGLGKIDYIQHESEEEWRAVLGSGDDKIEVFMPGEDESTPPQEIVFVVRQLASDYERFRAALTRYLNEESNRWRRDSAYIRALRIESIAFPHRSTPDSADVYFQEDELGRNWSCRYDCGEFRGLSVAD